MEQLDWVGDKPTRRRQPKESHSELRDALADVLGFIPPRIKSGGSVECTAPEAPPLSWSNASR